MSGRADPSVVEFLAEHRDAMLGRLLSFKERRLDPHLPPDISRELRTVILDEVNDYCSLVFTMLETSTAQGVVVNEAYLAKIDEIYDAVAGAGVAR